MLPERKQIHLKNFDYANKDYPYFVTICCYDKQAHFDDVQLASEVIGSIHFLQNTGNAVIYCYCLMPDHLHVVLSLGKLFNKDLGELITYFKRFTSKAAKDVFGIDKLWQKNYHEHVVRKREDLRSICEYVLNNPVRKGLAANKEDYPFSGIIAPPPVI